MINPMNEVQITESLKGLLGWTYEDNKLHKIYKFNDFPEAMAFLVRLSYEAENRNHHSHQHKQHRREKEEQANQRGA